jgi:hypothetical protein
VALCAVPAAINVGLLVPSESTWYNDAYYEPKPLPGMADVAMAYNVTSQSPAKIVVDVKAPAADTKVPTNTLFSAALTVCAYVMVV